MAIRKNTLIVSAAALLLAAGTTAGAAVITPTSATSTTTIGGSRTIAATIDGSDLTNVSDPGSELDDVHDINSDSAGYWLSGNGAASGTTEVLTFNLGGTYDVDGIHHWLYVRSGELSRALKTFDIWFSTDGGSNYNLGVSKGALGNFTIETGGPNPVQTKTFAALEDATHIQLRNLESFDTEGNKDYLGLSEIRFNAVPEPGSLALMGLGGLLIGARRRRA